MSVGEDEFISLQDFKQDSKFPHKSTKSVADDMAEEFIGIIALQVGPGLTINSDDPSYPTLTVQFPEPPTPFTLPTADESTLGAIRLGAGLSNNPGTGQVDVVFPTPPAPYSLPQASTTVLGGLKLGTGLSLNGGTNQVDVSFPAIPQATSSVLGGIKLGANLSFNAQTEQVDVSLPATSKQGRLLAIQIFSTSGVYNKPPGITENGFVIIKGVGPGGPGGGAVATPGELAVAGGGGGGAFCEARIAIANISDGATITVGTKGIGGANTGAVGSVGTHTTIELNGGTGLLTIGRGAASGVMASGTSFTNSGGGNGGQVTTSGVTTGLTILQAINGEPGGYGIRFSGTQGLTGKGGSSMMAPATRFSPTNGTGSDGWPGVGYGAGGSGAASIDATGYTGGDGSDGYVIIYTYA